MAKKGGISIIGTLSQQQKAGGDGKSPAPKTDLPPPPPTAKRLPPRPMIATISLWTTSRSGKLTRRNFNDSGHETDDSDSDSSDEHEHADDDDDQDNNNQGKPKNTGRFFDDERDHERDEYAELEHRLNEAKLPDYVRRVADKEMRKLRRMPSFMADYTVTRGYLEWLAEMPWNESTQEHIDLRKSRRDLDQDHYGMGRLKERVLQYLAVRKLKLGMNSKDLSVVARSAQPILMFVGPPGTGKTSIAQSIASSLGRKFQRISLGGVGDQSSIRGHRRTYIGSMPGRIIQGIKQAGVNNPVFLLDELDKMTAGPQGDPSGALLEVLDPEQNNSFTDHYLNLPFDLSRVLFIATANSLDNIPAALLDRMEVIHIAGYTHDEKFNIARQHLVPKQVIDNGLKLNMIIFKDDALHKIISNYAREAGVRQLERRIATICRCVAVRVVESESSTQHQQAHQHHQPDTTSHNNQKQQQQHINLPVIIDADSLEQYLGPVVYDRESRAGRANVPGVAIGLAWTATGGEITFVEAEIMNGARRDSLVLTGQLGSVMRESAMLALNWIRANFHLYDSLPQTLGRDLVENTVHIHFPAGAVGKDGPSAGVTIITALMSLCSNISVAPDLAMTGEITLRGLVLKVGGVKSKVLAAHRAGIKRVILPAKNESDLSDICAPIREQMRFHFVNTVDEVIRIAFDGKLIPKGNFIADSLASKL